MRYNVNLLKADTLTFLGKNINECYDSKYLFSLYEENCNNLYRYGSFNNGKCKLKIDILENYILYLFDKKTRTLEEETVLKKASTFYNEMGKGRKSFLLNNMIFNNIDYLGRKFFKDYEIILANMTSVSKEVRVYYDKYMNNELNSVEKTRLMEFLIGKIGNKNYEKSLENLFNKIINSKNNISISEKNFLIQYINYNKCKRLDLPLAKVYITKKDLNDGKDLTGAYKGVSHGATGIIGLNEYDFEPDFNIFSENFKVSRGALCLTTIHHELEHYNQNTKAMNGVLNESSFAIIKSNIFRTYLSNSDFDEYKKNYKYRESEREANINGWRDTAKLLEQYSKNNKFKEIEQCYYLSRKTNMEKANSWQMKKKDNKEEKVAIETYNIKNLINIVKNNPKVLNQYTQLNEFFDKSGNISSPFSFIEKYTDLELKKLSTNDKDIRNEINGKQVCYEEFINYLFINKNFETLNFNNYNNYEAMITFFSLLGQKFFDECKKIKNMCKTFNEENIDEFISILNDRKNRLNKYYEFINNNQELINKLNIYNQEHLNNRHRLFNWYLNLEEFNSELKNVDGYLDNLKNNTDILKGEAYGRRI